MDIFDDLHEESAFDALLADLKQAFGDDHAALGKVLEIISQYSGEQIYVSRRHLQRLFHVAAAAKLLNSSLPYREIPSALAARFGISTNTARRVRDFAYGRELNGRQRTLDL